MTTSPLILLARPILSLGQRIERVFHLRHLLLLCLSEKRGELKDFRLGLLSIHSYYSAAALCCLKNTILIFYRIKTSKNHQNIQCETALIKSKDPISRLREASMGSLPNTQKMRNGFIKKKELMNQDFRSTAIIIIRNI